MKNLQTHFIYFLSVIFFISLAQPVEVQAQVQVQVGGSFSFNTTLDSDVSKVKKLSGKGITYIKKGWRVSVVKVEDDMVWFKYWRFSSDSIFEKEINGKDGLYIYSMPLKDFKELTVPLYPLFKGFSGAAYSVPNRLRGIGKGGTPFNFDANLSLGANLVFGWGSAFKTESLFDASLGIGITKIDLNKENSSITEDDRTATAFTVNAGVVFKPTKAVNLGVFLGWDFLGSKDKEAAWDYNRKSWIGIGVNIGISGLKENENTGKSKN